jgi:tetratricopeptide (TPR) repeat protein
VLAEALLARGEYKTGEAARGFLTRALALIDEIDPVERRQPRVLITRAKIVTQLGDMALPEENERRQREVLAMADAVLAQQPQSAPAQRLKFWANWSLGKARGKRPPDLHFLTEAEKLAFALHQRDPTADDDWYLVLLVRRLLAAHFTEVGRISDAAAVWHRTAVDGGHPATLPEPPTGKARRFIKGVLQSTAFLEASRGNAVAADLAFAAQRQHPLGAKAGPAASPRAALALNALSDARQEVQFKLLRGDYAGVMTQGHATLDQLRAIFTGPATKAYDRVLLRSVLDAVRETVAEALIQRGRFAEAEAMLVKTVELLPPQVAKATPYTPTQQIWLALALARQNRSSEALTVLTPTLTTLRRQWDAGSPRAEQRELLARVFFVEAVAQPATPEGRARRQAALAEAQKILDAMTEEARQLYYPRVLRKWIAEERARTL